MCAMIQRRGMQRKNIQIEAYLLFWSLPFLSMANCGTGYGKVIGFNTGTYSQFIPLIGYETLHFHLLTKECWDILFWQLELSDFSFFCLIMIIYHDSILWDVLWLFHISCHFLKGLLDSLSQYFWFILGNYHWTTLLNMLKFSEWSKE